VQVYIRFSNRIFLSFFGSFCDAT